MGNDGSDGESIFSSQIEAQSISRTLATSPMSSRFATSDCAENNGTMSTVPEDPDEAWSDAREVIEADEDAVISRIEVEEIHGGHSNSNAVHISGPHTEGEAVDLIPENKTTVGVIVSASIDPPLSSSETSATPPTRSSTSRPVSPSIIDVNPSIISSSVPPTPQTAQTLDVPPSNSGRWTPSPTPHSAASLDRRQSRRRSIIVDVCLSFTNVISCSQRVKSFLLSRTAPL